MVAHFQVMDGVVAYGFLDLSGNPGCGYATYDPAKAAWQKRSYLPYAGLGYDVLFISVDTRDGVLVFSYRWSISGMATSTFRADMYDSALGKWFSDVSPYGPEVIFNDGFLTCLSSITNSTIYTTIYHPTLGAIYSIFGAMIPATTSGTMAPLSLWPILWPSLTSGKTPYGYGLRTCPLPGPTGSGILRTAAAVPTAALIIPLLQPESTRCPSR